MTGRKILGYASQGGVRQHGGSLPVFACDRCGNEIVFPTSKKTGRKYAANVRRSYRDARYYIGAEIHRCDEILAERERYASDQRVAAYRAARSHEILARKNGVVDEAQARGLSGPEWDPETTAAFEVLFAEMIALEDLTIDDVPADWTPKTEEASR